MKRLEQSPARWPHAYNPSEWEAVKRILSSTPASLGYLLRPYLGKPKRTVKAKGKVERIVNSEYLYFKKKSTPSVKGLKKKKNLQKLLTTFS